MDRKEGFICVFRRVVNIDLVLRRRLPGFPQWMLHRDCDQNKGLGCHNLLPLL